MGIQWFNKNGWTIIYSKHYLYFILMALQLIYQNKQDRSNNINNPMFKTQNRIALRAIASFSSSIFYRCWGCYKEHDHLPMWNWNNVFFLVVSIDQLGTGIHCCTGIVKCLHTYCIYIYTYILIATYIHSILIKASASTVQSSIRSDCQLTYHQETDVALRETMGCSPVWRRYPKMLT